jgi:hypothetical protein
MTVNSEQCKAIIKKAMAGLKLPSLSSGEIVARRRPFERQSDRTVLMWRGITLFDVEERQAPGTCAREDIGYGIGLFMAVPSDAAMYDNVALIPTWRQTIRPFFDRKRVNRLAELSGEGIVLTTTVEAGTLNVPQKGHRYETSQMVIRCWLRESRT